MLSNPLYQHPQPYGLFPCRTPLARIASAVYTRVGDETIGSGAYCQVYPAADRSGRQFACKVIDCEGRGLFGNLVDCKRILRELTLLSSLRHPNVVAIVDVIAPSEPDSYNELAVVFDRLDFDLQKVLSNEKQALTLEHVQYMLYQLTLGVDALHAHDILHRDLKPVQ